MMYELDMELLEELLGDPVADIVQRYSNNRIAHTKDFCTAHI